MTANEEKLELNILQSEDKPNRRKMARVLLTILVSAVAIVIKLFSNNTYRDDLTYVYIISTSIIILSVSAPILLYFGLKRPSKGRLILQADQITIKRRRLKVIMPINQINQICINQKANLSGNAEESELNVFFEFGNTKQNIAIEELFVSEKQSLKAIVQIWQTKGINVSCDI